MALTSKTYGTMYYVDTMKTSVEYFQKVLGVKPDYASDDWTEFPFEGHKLCLHSKTSSIGKTEYLENGVLIFHVDGIEKLFAQMKEEGFDVFGLHSVHPGASTFHFKDPSQNEFSFYGKP